MREKRVQKILPTCQKLLREKCIEARGLASFTGQIISMMPVVDDLARLHTRYSQIAIAQAERWDSLILISAEIRSELIFWFKNVERLNIKYFFDQEVPKRFVSIMGDASNTGCGSFIVDTDHVAAKLFSPEEREYHSTWRELENIRFTIEAFKPFLQGQHVKFMTDSQSARTILQRGSMKADCHVLAKQTVEFCLQNDISLDVQWIPRSENEIADQISRQPIILDSDDWGLTDEFFQFLQRRYGRITLDCFANDYNCKVDRFLSLFHTPGSSGIDAFSFNWANEFVLLVPPVSIIGRALQHLRLCRASGVLVAPCWPSSYFWPMLINDFSSCIVDILKVKGANIIVHGHNHNSLLGSKNFKGSMLVMHVDCSV